MPRPAGKRPVPDTAKVKGVTRSQVSAGTRSNYIPILPPDLLKAYRDFNRNLTPAQRKELNIHSEANPTGELRPIQKSDSCIQVDNWEQSTPPQGFTASEWLQSFSDPTSQEQPAQPDHPTYLHILTVLAILRRVLRVYEVSSQQDQAVRLHGDCVAVALGIPGYQAQAIANTYNLSKQAISKRVRVIARALALPTPYSQAIDKLPRGLPLDLAGKPRPIHPRKRRQHPQISKSGAMVGGLPTDGAHTGHTQGVSGGQVGCMPKESFCPPPNAGRRQQTHPKNGERKV